MIRLCVISYYGPIDSIKLAEDYLSSHENVLVFDFALFKYMYDQNDKIINYDDILISYIQDNKIEYVLWWFINIDTNKFIYIKNKTNIKYLLFNWDEPYNWDSCDIINKMKYFDAVFVTCKETINIYTQNNCKYAVCLYPGFDTLTNYIIEDIQYEDYIKYSCDISFCCTNLYENQILYPDQYINRKQLIDDIYNNQNIFNYKFNIYGPKFLKKLYPKSYKNIAKYNELNKIFNYSKINLCTHVLNNKYGYLNERVFLIGGSGGLLLVDYVKGIENIFDINNEIIILNKSSYIEQIVYIIKNYNKYILLKKNINTKCNKLYNYQIWSNKIIEIINKLNL